MSTYASVRKKDALSELEPAFIRENADFINSYKNINWEDINTLNLLLKQVDLVLRTYPTPNDSIKRCIEVVFKQILNRYPLLFGYWKRFTSIEYQFHDLSTSLKVLEAATISFAHSVDLWCDYLRVLITNYPKETKVIETKIKRAKELVGWQFYSHTFWDIVVDYYEKNSIDLIPLYNDIVRIPLHQYAKYVTSFKTLLTAKKLLSDIPKVDAAVKENQVLVNQIWTYESVIKQNYFNLTPLAQTEIDNWEKYLKYLIDGKKPIKLIESVFERSLIPCCFLEKIWIMYADWDESHHIDQDIDDVYYMISLYERGSESLSLKSKEFRLKFLDYLEKNFTKCDKTTKQYKFEAFNKLIKNLLEIWPQNKLQIQLIERYLILVKRFNYHSTIDMPPNEILSIQAAYCKYLEDCIYNYLDKKTNPTEPLQDMINDTNLSVVVSELIKMNWLVLKNNLQTRKYFNYCSKLPSLRSSTTFWLTYYKFEKSNKNFTKLNKFVSELGTDIFLPTSVINDIITDYKTFYLVNANMNEYEALQSSTVVSGQSQMKVENNSVLDPIFDLQFKINNPQWTQSASKSRINKVEWYKDNRFKQNGHPGIFEETPQITNSIIDRSTKSFKNIPPGLPTFRNLEKINQPAKYKDTYTEEYLKP